MPTTTPEYWLRAKRALARRDPRLKAIIRSYRGEALRLRGRGFQTLARAIVGQQISTKAADSIWRRMQTAVVRVTPARVASAPAELLRAAGLSNAKVVYMQSLAAHFLENSRQIRKWPLMTDEEIVGELVSIRGIGRWTAEMFLIFSLGRPDIFPIDDLGLLRGIHRHYNAGEKMSKPELLAIGETWRPYRSLGTWYMWRVLDPVPVEY
ncbi:MAG TPA: DNA-3-methyladenine glycosylase 2 family protein [Lacipirellulaceae bacterium]|jgi:DNA-3-methyladenine glycosylase II